MLSQPELISRFNYHPPRDQDDVAQHTRIRDACLALAEVINHECPDGREKALAITNTEQVMFWANAAVARVRGGHVPA